MKIQSVWKPRAPPGNGVCIHAVAAAAAPWLTGGLGPAPWQCPQEERTGRLDPQHALLSPGEDTESADMTS